MMRVVVLGSINADLVFVVETLPTPGQTLLASAMTVEPVETAAMIRRANARGARTIHNLAPAAPLAPDALRLLDVLVVNEDEAAWLARHEALPGGDAPALHAGLGITVIRTLGGDGVEWAGRDGHGRIPAAPIHAIDTTAVGDCFVGVLAATWIRGASLPAAIRRATVAASLACTRRGSQGGLPSSAEIDQAIKDEISQ